MDTSVKRKGAVGRPSIKEELAQLVASIDSTTLTVGDVEAVAQRLWADLDTPVSLKLSMLLSAGQYDDVVQAKIDPGNYLECDVERFYDDYIAVKLLAKFPCFTHPNLDPVSAARDSSREAEARCAATNRRLTGLLCGEFTSPPSFMNALFRMRDDIHNVLGGFDPTEWENCCRLGRKSVAGQQGIAPYEKFGETPSCTPSFVTLGVALLAQSDTWLQAWSNSSLDFESDLASEIRYYMESMTNGIQYIGDVKLVAGDRVVYVPKNARTMRSIRPQPGLNIYAQLGLGAMIRRKLGKAGLDLSTQSPNQELARIGSVDDRFATIDLKSASDTVASRLVEFLIPDRWLHAMNLCRTHFEENEDGTLTPLYKFSAMGNGFTFELETLIFWAAVRAIRAQVGCGDVYRCYGDDIVCSKAVAHELIPFLQFLGFQPNVDKTYVNGPFRESCGADWFNGTLVTPYYLDFNVTETDSGHTAQIVIIANGIRRLALRRNHGFGCDRRFRRAWVSVVLSLPSNLRHALKRTWTDEDDGGLITHPDDVLSNPYLRYCGNLQTIVRPLIRAVTRKVEPETYHAAKCAMLYKLAHEEWPGYIWEKTSLVLSSAVAERRHKPKWLINLEPRVPTNVHASRTYRYPRSRTTYFEIALSHHESQSLPCTDWC